MISGERLAEWLSMLVQVPSINPAQAGDESPLSGEDRLSKKLMQWFHDFGGEVEVDEIVPGRSNIYGVWRSNSKYWMAIDIHTDTVGIDNYKGDPFAGLVSNDRVWGRGAVDTKASLAVVLALLEDMKSSNKVPSSNLLIAATIDEERDVKGALGFRRWIKKNNITLNNLVVAEPTLCQPIYGHKGALRLTFELTGKAAHSSNPSLGRNAILEGARLVAAMEKENARLTSIPAATNLGPASLTVTMISGGVNLNTVPDKCIISIDRRIIAGEDTNDVRNWLTELAQSSVSLPIHVQTKLDLEAFFQPPQSDFVKKMVNWSGEEAGIVPFGSNACVYQNLAEQCVLIGPGSISQAHADEEWVEIAQLEKMAEIYLKWWFTP